VFSRVNCKLFVQPRRVAELSTAVDVSELTGRTHTENESAQMGGKLARDGRCNAARAVHYATTEKARRQIALLVTTDRQMRHIHTSPYLSVRCFRLAKWTVSQCSSAVRCSYAAMRGFIQDFISGGGCKQKPGGGTRMIYP